MAITFEDENNKKNWFAIFSIILVIVFIGITVFYLFFSQPQVAEKFIFPKFKTIADFKNISFNFDEAMDNPTFKNLKTIINFTLPSQDQVGKANPFIQ